MNRKWENSSLGSDVKAGNIRALSRLITMLESNDPEGKAILETLGTKNGSAETIGITGYPGAGKSTLINRLTTLYRAQGKKVGVLAIDTSSPFTGGAILGDRIRMQDHSCDKGVFIRSMATRGHHGGLARYTGEAIRVLTAAGYDIVLVETVGVGQEEGEIANIVQTVVVVVAPGLGDDVQAMKAGLLEVAHLVVVNKADREGAQAAVQDLQDWVPQVLMTRAERGEGVAQIIEAIAAQQPNTIHRSCRAKR